MFVCSWIATGCATRGDSGGDAPQDASVVPGHDGGDAGIPGALSCDDHDWCPVATNIDRRYSLTAIWGSAERDVWAVGSGGTVIHWNGASWSGLATGTSDTIHAVWGSGPNDVWAVASTRTILHAEGLARGFSGVPAIPSEAWEEPGRLYAVGGTGPADVRVAGAPRSFDNLDNCWSMTREGGVIGWTPMAAWDDPATLAIRSMWISPDDIWLLGEALEWTPAIPGIVLHARPAQSPTFARIDPEGHAELHAIWGSAPGDVWIVGDRGTILHLVPGSERFVLVGSPVTVDLFALGGTGPNDIWAVGDRGTAIHFDGAHWTTSTVALPPDQVVALRGVWASSPNDAWAVGGDVAIHFTGSGRGR